MYGNVQQPNCSPTHWVKAKPTNSIFVGYRSNLTKKKKKTKNREKEQEKTRKRVRSTTRDATQARPPIPIPTAALLR